MKWLRILFGLCIHNWEIIQKVDVIEDNEKARIIGTKYTQCCKNCGEMRFFRNF